MDEEKKTQQKPDIPDDFDTCRGACGYEIWCRDCIKYKKEPEKPTAATGPEGSTAGQDD